MTELSQDHRAIYDSLSAPSAVIALRDGVLIYTECNRAFHQQFGMTYDQVIGCAVFDLFPETPEREKIISGCFLRAIGGEPASVEEFRYTVPDPHKPGEMTELYWNMHATPIIQADGRVEACVIHTDDVTREVKTRLLKDAIARELQHRVGNLFAMISSIARRTAPGHDSLDSFLPSFLDRLHALAETNSLLTGSDWNGLTLRRMIERQLASLVAENDGRITMTGPDLVLPASEAQLLSMAVHELATNATKYGALSTNIGTLDISWTLSGSGGYVFNWLEQHLEDVNPPTRQGFGTTLLTRILPRQLEGEVQQNFEQNSHRFRLIVGAKRARHAV